MGVPPKHKNRVFFYRASVREYDAKGNGGVDLGLTSIDEQIQWQAIKRGGLHKMNNQKIYPAASG
jgi:hypothetical protein